MRVKKLEDTKGVFTRHQSKNDKQYSGQKKRTNYDLWNIKQNTKDRDEYRCSGRLGSSDSLHGILKIGMNSGALEGEAVQTDYMKY
jgi:hypothetical protein